METLKIELINDTVMVHFKVVFLNSKLRIVLAVQLQIIGKNSEYATFKSSKVYYSS